MDYFKYLFYGLVQGLTEFLPISSSAHLKIFSQLFNLEDPGSSLSAIIQIGSVFAILIYFKEDLINILGKKSENNSLLNKRFLISIFMGTISILLLGILIKFIIPNFYDSFLRSNQLIGITSIFTGLLMYLSEMTKNKNISLKNHSLADSFFIGLAQAFAIIPGFSRSGITITSALFLGWNKVDATKFSFLLGIPAISISAIVEIYSSLHNDLLNFYGPFLVALLSAFFTSLIAIKLLIRYISFKGFKIFVYYKVFFGLIILLENSGFFKI